MVARSERRGEWVTWAALGLGVGIVAGFALAETVGRVDRKRVARAVDRLGKIPPPAPLSADRAAQAAAVALARTPGLADLELEVRALGPGRVELLGWVPDRKRRALAERTVGELEGMTGVVNRILVEHEDSDAPVAALALEGHPA
jgi:hypothetical protein